MAIKWEKLGNDYYYLQVIIKTKEKYMTLEIIIDALIKQGYSESEAEELLRKFVEEQAQLDRIRDYLHDIIN